MSWSYLSFRYHLFFYLFMVVSYLVSLYILLLLTIFIYLLLLFFYRKKNYLKVVEDPCLQKCFTSPINGEVISLEKKSGETEIKLKLPWFQRADLVMPTNAEVSNMQAEPFWVEFETPKGHFFTMNLKGRSWIRRRAFYLLAGDRARSGAIIGFMLLGGEVLLKLGESYTIMVEQGALLKAGSTPLATLQD